MEIDSYTPQEGLLRSWYNADFRGGKLGDNDTFVRGFRDSRTPPAIHPAMGSAGSPDPASPRGGSGYARASQTEPRSGRSGSPRPLRSPRTAGTLASVSTARSRAPV